MKRIRAGEPVSVGDLILIPLEQTMAAPVEEGKGGFVIYASKTVIGVVVRSPEGVRALDGSGKPASLEVFVEMVEGLGEMLGV